MKLFEFEAKEILRRYGVATPAGIIARSPATAVAIANELGAPVALKAQALVSGRGQAGGILFAEGPHGAASAASRLLGSTLKGCRVDTLLVEEQLDVAGQFYLSMIIDRQARRYVALASDQGGVNIEQAAAESAGAVMRHPIDPDQGFGRDEAERLVERVPGISQHLSQPVAGKEADSLKGEVAAIASILATLYRVAIECDAELVEINPLVRLAPGSRAGHAHGCAGGGACGGAAPGEAAGNRAAGGAEAGASVAGADAAEAAAASAMPPESTGPVVADMYVAADARIIIDDNALYRHPEFAGRALARADDTPMEAAARQQDLTYVDLEGDIGIVGNGAGLVMATMDLIRSHGGEPANFLDIGGGAAAEVIRKGLTFVMSKPEVKAVLVNVLGGITRCDEVARGVIEALQGARVKKPIAIRMMGTNEREGTLMLEQAGVAVHMDMETAAREIMRLKQGPAT